MQRQRGNNAWRVTGQINMDWLSPNVFCHLYSTELYVDLQHAVRRDIRRVQWFNKRVLPQMQDSVSTGYCVHQGRWSCERLGGKPDERHWIAMRRCGVKQSTENKGTKLRFYREKPSGSFKLVEHWSDGLKRWPASRKQCSRIFNTYSRMLKTQMGGCYPCEDLLKAFVWYLAKSWSMFWWIIDTNNVRITHEVIYLYSVFAMCVRRNVSATDFDVEKLKNNCN